MIYTSAIYANPEHTQVTGTDANGNTETRSIDNPHEFRREDEFITGFLAGGGVIEPYVAPVASTGYRLYKSTLVRRLNEQEAMTLTAVLDASPVKSRMLWDASEWLQSEDPLFADLEAAIGGALGVERAAEILAAD